MNAQRGVSLLEVLIAVVVLSIGLLGIAALQANALRANESALVRSQAVMLADLMLDAMRANPQPASAGAYNSNGWLCAAPSIGGSLAQNDLSFWIQRIKDTLGNSADSCGRITCNAVAGRTTCTVEVRWNDERARGNAQEIVSVTSEL